jgi:probable F420-dependent oxidoreductase
MRKLLRSPRTPRRSAVKVYASTRVETSLMAIADHARRVERLQYDGLTVPEARHDGLLLAARALDATNELKVATSVLVAFPRSPMVVACAAWDLAAHSGGRFVLGLGSQVRANIVDRYSTPWSRPVPRMREYVQAVRAIWRCWQQDEPLDFQGEHYRFTRMQPLFNPGPIAHPEIPIHLGAVGSQMTRLAGEVADGVHTHPSTSDHRMVLEHTLPLIAEGAERSRRAVTDVELVARGDVLTGATADDVAHAREDYRRRMAIMWSTPNYWKPLALRGRHDLGPRLRELTRLGRWDELPRLVPDSLIDELVPAGTYAEIVDLITAMWSGLAVTITFPLPEDPAHDHQIARLLAELREM